MRPPAWGRRCRRCRFDDHLRPAKRVDLASVVKSLARATASTSHPWPVRRRLGDALRARADGPGRGDRPEDRRPCGADRCPFAMPPMCRHRWPRLGRMLAARHRSARPATPDDRFASGVGCRAVAHGLGAALDAAAAATARPGRGAAARRAATDRDAGAIPSTPVAGLDHSCADRCGSPRCHAVVCHRASTRGHPMRPTMAERRRPDAMASTIPAMPRLGHGQMLPGQSGSRWSVHCQPGYSQTVPGQSGRRWSARGHRKSCWSAHCRPARGQSGRPRSAHGQPDRPHRLVASELGTRGLGPPIRLAHPTGGRSNRPGRPAP